jgi:hypothetical protein
MPGNDCTEDNLLSGGGTSTYDCLPWRRAAPRLTGAALFIARVPGDAALEQIR